MLRLTYRNSNFFRCFNLQGEGSLGLEVEFVSLDHDSPETRVHLRVRQVAARHKSVKVLRGKDQM